METRSFLVHKLGVIFIFFSFLEEDEYISIIAQQQWNIYYRLQKLAQLLKLFFLLYQSFGQVLNCNCLILIIDDLSSIMALYLRTNTNNARLEM